MYFLVRMGDFLFNFYSWPFTDFVSFDLLFEKSWDPAYLLNPTAYLLCLFKDRNYGHTNFLFITCIVLLHEIFYNIQELWS